MFLLITEPALAHAQTSLVSLDLPAQHQTLRAEKHIPLLPSARFQAWETEPVDLLQPCLLHGCIDYRLGLLGALPQCEVMLHGGLSY